ncbi:unnamed protein product [Boreogadus saida]
MLLASYEYLRVPLEYSLAPSVFKTLVTNEAFGKRDLYLVVGHYARECVPEAAEGEDVGVAEEVNSTDSEEEEPEDSDYDDMQTDGDPGGVPESRVETKVQNQRRHPLSDVAAGGELVWRGIEWREGSPPRDDSSRRNRQRWGKAAWRWKPRREGN